MAVLDDWLPRAVFVENFTSCLSSVPPLQTQDTQTTNHVHDKVISVVEEDLKQTSLVKYFRENIGKSLYIGRKTYQPFREFVYGS